MFAIVVDDGERQFYFAGWEGSDTAPEGGEMTYWKSSINNPEAYEFEDPIEAKIDLQLVRETGLESAIGLPDDFNVFDSEFFIERVRANHD
jgi:hypothetical protein